VIATNSGVAEPILPRTDGGGAIRHVAKHYLSAVPTGLFRFAFSGLRELDRDLAEVTASLHQLHPTFMSALLIAMNIRRYPF